MFGSGALRLWWLLPFLLSAQLAVADQTINQLGAGAALGGTEQIPMFQGANPALTTTPNALKAYIGLAQSALVDGGSIPVVLGAPAINAYTLTLSGNGHVIANPTGTISVGAQVDFLITGAGFFLGSFNGAANGWGSAYTWATGSPAIINTVGGSVTEVKCTVIAATPTLLCYGPINSAVNQTTAAAPAGPNSTTLYTMQGLAASIVPATTGNIVFTFNATIQSTITTAGSGLSYQCSYGTGAAPLTNGVLAGTQVGGIQTYTEIATAGAAANVNETAFCSGIILGATAGTAYWIDVAAKAITTVSAAKFVNANIVAWEVR